MNFQDFNRILTNYINNSREYNIRDRQYQSSIDKEKIGKRLEFVRNVIDDFSINLGAFNDFIRKSTYVELAFEREKLNYSDISKIIELEQTPVLNTLIHNLFFDSTIYIEASELNYIIENAELKNICLRIILSFANSKYGQFNNLVFDPTTIQSGKRQLYYNDKEDQATGYCHKYFIKNATNGFGDRILTAFNATHSQNSDNETQKAACELQNVVKQFAKTFHDKFYGYAKNVREVLDEILSEQLKRADFSDASNIKWYIIKYKEFFYNADSTTYLVLRRKNYGAIEVNDDNVYDIRCVNDWFDLYEPHYQPFYLSLSRYLAERKSTISIDEKKLFIRDNQIEYAHPCVLSNGWTIRIQSGGSWKVNFNGNLPSQAIMIKFCIVGEEFELINTGVDCIELMGNYIIECN